MKTVWWATLRHDMRIQARSGLYAVGIGVSIVFGGLCRAFVPMEILPWALPVVFMLGLSGTTYMFGAVMVLMDRTQSTLEALRVSPLLDVEYIGSKVLTLTLFALLESTIIYFVSGGWGVVPPLPLAGGALVLASTLALLGMGQVAPHESVTSFLIPGAVVINIVLQLPVFYAVDLGPAWMYYLVPSQAPFRLMLAAELPWTTAEAVYTLLVSLGFLGGAALYARARFRRHVGLPRRR